MTIPRQAATLSELKKALVQLPHDELLDVCLRLTKFKIDNKELLTYLLLKSHDEPAYAEGLCDEIDRQFRDQPPHKRMLRKIVRWMDRCLRFSGNKETELQVRIHFCRCVADIAPKMKRCRVTANLYATQLSKIEKTLDKVHPDLQFDFRREMAGLPANLR